MRFPDRLPFTPSALLAAALRHRPDRIIFGEIRDECANDLLAGNEHRPRWNPHNVAREIGVGCAFSRLSNLALSARDPTSITAFIRSETAEAIDFVLYCERDHNGQSAESVSLISVTGYDFAPPRAFETERPLPGGRQLADTPLEGSFRASIFPVFAQRIHSHPAQEEHRTCHC